MDREEGRNDISHHNTTEGFDAADRPFDFVDTDAETALVCEPDVVIRDKVKQALKSMGYQAMEARFTKDALRSMRFHHYDVVVINELFDPSESGKNEVLDHLASIHIAIRRQMFVALLSNTYRTMANMQAFNKSVNVIINMKNIDDVGTILKSARAENAFFYHIMKGVLKKMGKL
jgi:DNA-binding NtrC family response regulator